jgi:pimeloyl-ACP methyl ester carboxylesterase
MIVWIAVAVCAVVCIAIPFVLELMKTQRLDERARGNASGQFIELSAGITHYELSGPPEARTVVLVHGFSIPLYIWDRNVSALTDAGFRVLRYDLFGRGYSDRPSVKYTMDLLVGQLRELLDRLNITTPVHLAGLSMGGAIAVGFTARYPELVDRLCLISPAGFRMEEPFAQKLVKLPFVGRFLFTLIGRKSLMSRLDSNFHHPEKFPDFAAKFSPQLGYRGYLEALRSSMRFFPLGSMREDFLKLKDRQKQTLLLWGRQDRIIPFAVGSEIREALPAVNFVPIEDTGHNSNYEAPEIVNGEMIRFLKG